MAKRSDILFEVDTTLDGGGNYAGPWVDASEIHSVILTFTEGLGGASGYPKLRLSSDTTNIIRSIENVSPNTEYLIPSRYFDFQISAGTANATLRLSIKALS